MKSISQVLAIGSTLGLLGLTACLTQRQDLQATWTAATVLIDPDSVPADGATEAMVFIDLSGVYEAAAPSATVVLTSSDPCTLIRQPGPVGADGKTFGGVRAMKPGVQVITAWFATGYGLKAVGRPARVTFTSLQDSDQNLPEATGDPVLSLVPLYETAAADAHAPAAFVLTFKDSLGRPLEDCPVSLRPSRPGDQVLPAQGVTDAQGRVEVALTATALGEGGVVASAGSITAQASVNFVAEAPQVAQSTLQARVQVVHADGVEALGWDMLARDGAGRVVPHATVSFSSDVQGDVLSPRVVVADATGLATSWLRGTKAGPRTVTATLQSGAVTALGSLVVGAASVSASTLVANPNAVLADGISSATLTLTARDAFGNMVPNAAVTWGADGLLNTFTPATSVTDANGMASATVTSIRAQDQNVWATCEAARILAPLTFYPGPLVAYQSSISVSSDFQPADGQSPITLIVQLRDALGNGVPNAPLQLSTTGNPVKFSAIDGFTNSSGVFTSALLSEYAGVHRVSAHTGVVRLDGAVHFTARAPSCPQSTLFGGPALVQTGRGAWYGLAAADVNDDGHLDLITPDNDSNTVSVLLGQGNGIFKNPSSYPTGQHPQSAVIADFNGDDFLDVVTADSSGRTVSVLINLGDGRLGPFTSYPIGATGSPWDIVVADFNEDGHSDVATANGSGDVSILLGQGDGTFAAPIVLPLTGQWINSLAVADLNHDGHQDIVTANAGNHSVSVVLGYGDSTFAPSVTYPSGQQPWAVVVADFDGDGNDDVACSNAGDYTVSLFKGIGDGSLSLLKTFPVGAYPTDLVAVDFNLDGNMDLVTLDYVAYSSSVLLGDGAMGMSAAMPSPMGFPGYSMLAGDFFGQGYPGLLTVSRDNAVNFRRGMGDGTFVGAFDAVPSFSAGDTPYDIFAGDFDGDGKMDLAVTNSSSKTVSVLLAQQAGDFLAPVAYPVGADPFGVDGGDLNGDGQIDLVVANTIDGTVSVLLGQGDGTFAAAIPHVCGSGTSNVKIADLDGDGLMDVAAVNASGNTVSILIGQGDGDFLPAVTYPVGQSPKRFALADLNGDENIDVITANENDGTISILLGQGNGILSSAVAYQAGAGPTAVAVGDFDEDGYMDVVTVNNNGNFALLVGVGDGNLLPALVWSSNIAYAANVWAMDFDGDGHLDLMSLANGTVSLSLGRGDGTFLSPSMFLAGQSPVWGSFAVDISDDKKLDVVAADRFLSRVNILLNSCDTN